MSALPPPTSAPAGWYPDPNAPDTLRYFDGRMWAPPSPHVPRFEQRPPHPQLPARAAVGALVILALSLFVQHPLDALLIELDVPAAPGLVTLALVGYTPALVWCAYTLRRWEPARWPSLGWPPRWSDLGWGVVTWLVVIAVQVSVALVIVALGVPFTSNVEPIGEYQVNLPAKIVAVVVVVIVAPLVEEYVFRGVVMRGLLSRAAAPVAIGAQGILFGAAHIDPARGTGNFGLAIVLSAVGVVLGASAFMRRRIGTTIVTHAIINGLVMVLLLSGVYDELDSPFEMLRAIA